MENSLSIVVTDSGLGGISVMAELEKNLRENPIAENIRLTFFNAVPDKNRGYNSMDSEEEKIAVFNAVLEGMVKWYNPDIILIACNTLSIVYPKTPFSKETTVKVLGIVDFGVDLVYESLSANNQSIAVLLGTPITINSGVHRKSLIKKDIESNRIIDQPCYLLESEIQDDPFGDQTRSVIKGFLEEAKKKITVEYKEICAAFCCTHYGYSQQLFEEEMQNIFSYPVKILNPNNSMSAYLTKNFTPNINHSQISTEIVGQVPIFKEEIDVLGVLLRGVSKKVCETLPNYHYKKDLFNLASK